MALRILAQVATLFASFAVAQTPTAGAAKEWVKQPAPEAFPSIWETPRLPAKDLYEVSPKMIAEAAATLLSARALVQVNCNEARALTSGKYKCESAKQPYVVRAVLQNKGTGEFLVHVNGPDLYVVHGSLGRPGPLELSPLVLNLPSRPTHVWVWTTGAM